MDALDLPADDRALEALLRERRFGPPDPNEATPWDFVLRWPGLAVRDRVWPIVSGLLLDADDVVRARAVELVRVWSEGADLTTPRLLTVAEQHADRFGDQEVEGMSLRYSLAFALSNRANAANGARVAAVLREMATREPIGGGAAGVLGCYDPAFAASRAQAWGDAQASWIEEAASSTAAFRRDAAITFLEALRGLGTETRARVLAAVEKTIQRDDATACALAGVQGLPPPALPAPSAEDCQRAIGLT